MTRLFFDRPQGVILLDGKKCVDKTAYVEGSFCLQYFPFDDDFLPINCAVGSKGKLRDDLALIRHGKDYIVRFCPKRKPQNAENRQYLQKVLEPTSGMAHCLTCHVDDSHKISVETKEELITLDVPCKVREVKFSCIPISNGQLLTVFAKLESGKTYVAVLHYLDDYTLLLDMVCDEVEALEDGLVVGDYLRDCLNRKCVRKLSFGGECFVEKSRKFERACEHKYIDEIIPYALVESVRYGDEENAQELLGEVDYRDALDTLGNFAGVCDCLDYKPFEITLLYSDCDGPYTKTFNFRVKQGKVQSVNLLRS